MNALAIVFGIIIIVLLYLLYLYVFAAGAGNTLQQGTVYLGTNTVSVPTAHITSLSAVSYNVSMWVYVNSWSNVSTPIFVFGDGSKTYFKLVLDGATPTLTCSVNTDKSSPEPVVVTKNFPIQKWCNVVINVDNQYVDCYLDGKLTMSQQVSSPFVPPSATNKSVNIVMGGSGNKDIYLSKVVRSPTTVNPQTVWTDYVSTSRPGDTVLPSYNIKLSLLNNGSIQNELKLF